MGRPKKPKAIPPKENLLTGFHTEDPDGFIKRCKETLRKVLNSKNIGFNSQESHNNKLIWTLASPSATKAKAKYVYDTIPFWKSKNDLYWISAGIEFEFKKGIYHLTSVNLLIFKGIATDPIKTALLRAEWAAFEEDLSTQHAQPHWHIYPSQINKNIEFIIGDDIQDFKPEDMFTNEGNTLIDEWDRSARFHFAMASQWHVNSNCKLQNDMGAESILNWLEGCINYTLSQFQFLYPAN